MNIGLIMRVIVKTWRQSRSIAMTIPKEMAEKLGIDAGDYIELVLDNNEIRLKKA